MANFNYNKVILGGRMTADPELKTTQSGIYVTNFTIAVNRKGKSDTADFINIIAWRQTAEFVAKYFKKGSSICITGNIQTRTWTDNSGNKRYATEVIADEITFVDSRTEAEPNIPATEFEALAPDDDLPF